LSGSTLLPRWARDFGNCVAADSYGCGLLGLTVSDLPYLAKAEKAGAGTTDYQSLKPKLATIS